MTKVSYRFSYFVLTETTHKPLRVAASKTLFSSVHVTATNYFDECFFYCVIIGRHCFDGRLPLIWDFFKRRMAASFEASVLKEALFYALSLQ